LRSEVTAALVAGPVVRADTGDPATQLRLRGGVVPDALAVLGVNLFAVDRALKNSDEIPWSNVTWEIRRRNLSDLPNRDQERK
jgi:hypothetical protein